VAPQTPARGRERGGFVVTTPARSSLFGVFNPEPGGLPVASRGGLQRPPQGVPTVSGVIRCYVSRFW
jgi:hypothetical protein